MSEFNTLPTELIWTIFSWLLPRESLHYRRLSRRINVLLLSPSFARLSLNDDLLTQNEEIRILENNCTESCELTALDREWMHWPDSFQQVYSETVFGVMALWSLDWAFEEVTGRIPRSVGLLSTLVMLDLSNNELVGEIPEEVGLLLMLECLALHHNELRGKIPSGVGRHIRLKSLLLSDNLLEGELPDLGGCVKMKRVDISHNFIEGLFPTSMIAVMTELVDLRINNNRFRGTKPERNGLSGKLEVLHIDGNLFAD